MLVSNVTQFLRFIFSFCNVHELVENKDEGNATTYFVLSFQGGFQCRSLLAYVNCQLYVNETYVWRVWH